MKDKLLLIKRIFFHLEAKEKFALFLGTILMILSSFAEVISIGTLIPFVTILFSPQLLFKFEWLIDLLTFLNIDEDNYINFFFFFFIFSVFLSSIIRIGVVYFSYRFPKQVVTTFSTKIFSTIVNKDYIDIIKINSGYIISATTEKLNLLSSIISQSLNALASSIVCILILTFLLFLDAFSVLMVFLFIGIFYFLVIFFIKKKLNKIENHLDNFSFSKINLIKETFGGIKRIILDNMQKFSIDNFSNVERTYRLSEANAQFLSVFPRFLIEMFAIIFLSTLAFFYLSIFNTSNIELLSSISVLAFSTQKLLPHANGIYNGFVIISTNAKGGKDIIDFYEENYIKDKNLKIRENLNKSKITFNKSINLNNISFKYDSKSPNILENFNFKICQGDKIAIVGKTGTGKTTLMDILIGLIQPTEGSIFIDDVKLTKENIDSWRKNCSLVPQDTFLLDDSVYKNISFDFNSNSKSINNVIKSAKSSTIHDFIESLPNKYETRVGENGIFLSGGQKQRLGIARALFQNKDLIFLDEPTSALDTTTESQILKNIMNLYKEKTIVFITHRDKNISIFDKVIKL